MGMEIVVPEEFRYLYTRDESRPVFKVPDPVLRQKSSEVSKITRKTQILIDDLFRIMRKANGIGLAAPQIGVLQRVIVVAPEGMKPTALINPRVIRVEGSAVGEEGCLSIPGLYGDVVRPSDVTVEAMDRKGRRITFELKALKARVVQHEIDHLDGILFIDKVDAATLHWTNPEKTAAKVE